jgi:hypothetical protein
VLLTELLDEPELSAEDAVLLLFVADAVSPVKDENSDSRSESSLDMSLLSLVADVEPVDGVVLLCAAD